MRICLDTNSYTAFKAGSMEILQILEDSDEVFVPVTVLGELYAGFRSGSLTEKNIKELDMFLSKPGIYVLDNNQETAVRYGFIYKELRKTGNPIPSNDIWIAASAMVSGTVLISRDRHFKKVPGLFVMDF